jgi:nucleoside 2-deoxyribosyltransferase
MKTVYLCGPINGCTDSEANDWRSESKHQLSTDFDLLDPMRRDYRGREDECVREIVELDKIDVMQSDIILVNYPQPSVGTAMEVFYAWEHGKMVVTVAPEKITISPWMRYHSTVIFHTFEEAFSFINKGF